jgi:hypothetical protein
MIAIEVIGLALDPYPWIWVRYIKYLTGKVPQKFLFHRPIYRLPILVARIS